MNNREEIMRYLHACEGMRLNDLIKEHDTHVTLFKELYKGFEHELNIQRMTIGRRDDSCNPYARTLLLLQNEIDVIKHVLNMKRVEPEVIVKPVHISDVTEEAPLEIILDDNSSELEEDESSEEEESYFQVNASCHQSYKSELHSVPYMQTCQLLGGARKKKVIVNRRRRFPRRRPDQSRIQRGLVPNDIMPPFKNVTLKYIDPLMQIAAPTQPFVVKTMRVNCLFDPDPLILTSGVAGFNELMLFYEFFRVNRVSVSWEPANNEAFQISVGFVFSNVNLSTLILTRQDALDALENGLTTRTFTLQNRNGGPSSKSMTKAINCSKILGNVKLYEGDVNYTGTSNTDPADQLFVNLIVASPTNTTLLLNGTVGKLELRFHALLFARRYLNDAFKKRKNLKDYSVDELREALKEASLKEIDDAYAEKKASSIIIHS